MNIIEKIYGLYKKSYTITTDSRNISKDCVFVALKGEHFDGNDFVLKVADDGIAACVIADRQDLPKRDRVFVVEDSLKALQELARLHREKLGLPVIGITGTNGKTTTKELAAAVLSKKYKIAFTQGNYNNQLGVPLTLLGITPGTDLAIVEMGASHIGDIKELTGIGKPDYGIITNMGRAHLEGFGGFEGVVRAKNEMYEYIAAHDGMVFVNHDNKLLMDLAKGIDKVTYGTDKKANVQGKTLSANPYLSIEWSGHKIETQLVGDYNFENVMSAICIGTYFKVAANDIVEALSHYRPTNNRSQVIKTAKNMVVMDAYNANPTSMRHAIKNFRNICKDDNMLILGDMRELGNESGQEHADIIKLLQELDFKNVYLVGREFSQVSRNSGFSTMNNVEELARHLEENPVSDKNILVKGSNSIHLNKIIDFL